MTNDEYLALLKDSEVRLDRLRSLYEQWFQGIERREPKQQREELERRVKFFRRSPVRNTALRFRTETFIQRFTSLQTYWSRVAREIEDGTHFRTLQRAKRRSKARDGAAEPLAAAEATTKAFDLDFGDLEDLDAIVASLEGAPGARPSAPPPAPSAGPPPPLARPKPASEPPSKAPAAAKGAPPPPPPRAKPPAPPPLPPGVARGPAAPPAVPRPAPATAPAASQRPPAPAASPASPASEGRFARPKTNAGVDAPRRAPAPPAAAPETRAVKAPGGDEEIRKIYERYVDARRKNNERVDNVRLETLAASIKKMLPELEQKHRGKKIDFEVVVKDGRVGLKPVPKD